MRLAPGQDAVLSLGRTDVDCRVVASAGAFVLLQPRNDDVPTGAVPARGCSLSFMDGLIPMVWEGEVAPGSAPGELRFQLGGREHATDRRSSVRLPVTATVTATVDGGKAQGQLLDVSAGGMRYRHPVQLAAGQLVRVATVLPHEGPVIDAEAVVRQSAPTGVTAVQFTAMYGASVQDVGGWTITWLRDSLKRR